LIRKNKESCQALLKPEGEERNLFLTTSGSIIILSSGVVNKTGYAVSVYTGDTEKKENVCTAGGS